MTRNILIIAGETSGDIHAANLIRNLKAQKKDLRFFGIGGKKMEEEGVELLARMEKLSIIGVSEIFAKLHDIRDAFKKISSAVKETPPDLAILIDYPGFNLRLAKSLKKDNVKIVYYITPQVWAWGKSRINIIRKYVDKALVIFKFEEELFKKHGIDATFVGHPLLDFYENRSGLKRSDYGLKEDRTTIALLPGSRESEVLRLLPTMLKTADIIVEKADIQFVLLKSSSVKKSTYEGFISLYSDRLALVEDNTYGCLDMSDFVFTSSGTATLECVIMEKPMLITYKTSLLTALCFKVFARTPFIGLANIIAGKEIAPEVLQYDAKPRKMAEEILSIILSPEKMHEQRKALKEIKDKLGLPGASMRASKEIASLID